MTAANLIAPYLRDSRREQREPIDSMPGDRTLDRRPDGPGGGRVAGARRRRRSALRSARGQGRRSAAAPGIPTARSSSRSQAIKAAAPELTVITDVCLCEYTTHGHCGVIDHSGRRRQRRDARTARSRRDLARRSRRGRRRAERHDGRPRRSDCAPRSTKKTSPTPRSSPTAPSSRARFTARSATPRIRRRTPRAHPEGPPRLPDGSGQRRAKRCAKQCSMLKKARTS